MTMKLLLLRMIAAIIALNLPVATAVAQGKQVNAACTKAELKADAKSVWYVPTDREKAHFVSMPSGAYKKEYVVKGDVLVSTGETEDLVCASYIRKGKASVFGWLKKADVKPLKPITFGAFDVDASQDLLTKANAELLFLGEHLPAIKDWRGTYRDKSSNSVRIWKKGKHWRLNTMGIAGTIGTGNNEEDSVSIATHGAIAEYRVSDKGFDVCDIVVIGFNNALLATSGSRCMGSGANHEFPEFNGLYWKQ